MNTTAPSPLLASANISKSGTDAISKIFLAPKNKWFKDNGEANTELLSVLESEKGTDGSSRRRWI